jgi:UDP-N-acetylglucosamine 2-epimerase
MNTIADAINIALKQQIKSDEVKAIIKDKFFFFTIHRQENIYNHELVLFSIKKALELANNMKCLFVLHAPTKEVLIKLHLLDRIKNHPNIIMMPRV